VTATESLYRDKARRILRVPNGRRCGFRIYKNTKMAEIMDKLTKSIWNILPASVQFNFAGTTVKPDDDFVSLCMRELDIVEVSHVPTFFELSPSSLASDFRKLVGSPEGADFVFKVGKRSNDMRDVDGDSTYREIPAHQWILRVRNERLKALFDSKMEESELGYAEILHYKPKIFEIMLEYLYTDEVSRELTANDYLELLALADEYVIPRLKRQCELKLIENIKEGSNILDLVAKAELYQANDLKKLSKQYLCKNFMQLGRNDPNFLKEIGKETLFELPADVESRTKRIRGVDM